MLNMAGAAGLPKEPQGQETGASPAVLEEAPASKDAVASMALVPPLRANAASTEGTDTTTPVASNTSRLHDQYHELVP